MRGVHVDLFFNVYYKSSDHASFIHIKKYKPTYYYMPSLQRTLAHRVLLGPAPSGCLVLCPVCLVHYEQFLAPGDHLGLGPSTGNKWIATP